MLFFLSPPPQQFLIETGKINILFRKPDLLRENYCKSPSNTAKMRPKVSLLFFFFTPRWSSHLTRDQNVFPEPICVLSYASLIPSF